MSVHPEHQPENVTAFRSERVIIAVEHRGHFKTFQIGFTRDGSLFVNFPYFRHRMGLLAAKVLPASGQANADIDLTAGGKVASHLVKYSHHPDGRAHFSQDGKVLTTIRRQAVALERQTGHLFTVLLQGLDAFDPVTPPKASANSAKRKVITFDIPVEEPFGAIKFVGRWHRISDLRVSDELKKTVGPFVPAELPDGRVIQGVMLANPREGTDHVLLVSCEPIHWPGEQKESLLFFGGFDAKEVMTDVNAEGGFLMFLYPVPNADALMAELGSTDFHPK